MNEKDKKLLKEILKDDRINELKKNTILIKDGVYSLSEKPKTALEKALGKQFKKNRFNEKNIYLFNACKEKLEELGYKFMDEKDLENELEKIEKENA